MIIMANITQIVKDLKKSLNSFKLDAAIQSSDNEAKTRMYLVEEFFKILRYNRGFENGCLIPEYDADFAHLKGKKVDYAITFRNKPEIIIEVKKAGLKLNNLHLRQLNEYFLNTNDSKIGILTNGIEYKFYCRNNNAGAGLHPTPFCEFNWAEIDNSVLEQLASIYATNLEVKKVLESAQEMFFLEGFEDALFKELADPSREFIKAIYSRMGGTRMGDSTEKQIKELINSVSVKTALENLIIEESKSANSGIITTDEEMKMYHIIKTILAQHKQINTDSIGYRDFKGKFSILIDDSLKKKVCDIVITQNIQRLEVNGEKFEIEGIDSVVKLKKKLIDRATSLL